MSLDFHAAAAEHWNSQPSPHAPGLTNGEYPVAVKLATKAKFGGHASAKEAELFWHEFKGLEMTPQEFEHAIDRLAPLSFTYHGRPPSMDEIKQMRDAAPGDIRKYYGDLPDRHYPDVPASAMVKHMQAAEEHFQTHLQRSATKLEARRLFHSGESAVEYAKRLRGGQPNDVVQTSGRGDGGDGSLDAPGRQAPDQRDRRD